MSGRILQNSNLIEVRQGDSFVIRMHFKRACKDVDLSGASIRMEVRDMHDNSLIFDKLATEIDVVNGRCALILTPTDTDIPTGEYYTDIQIAMPDGSINTFFPADVNRVGVFKVTEQVTR